MSLDLKERIQIQYAKKKKNACKRKNGERFVWCHVFSWKFLRMFSRLFYFVMFDWIIFQGAIDNLI